MNRFIQTLYSSMFLGRIFHTLNYELCKELKDCESVLDLGCGPSSPIKNCKNIKYSVGVEVYKPYLNISIRNRIHTKYLNQRIEKLNISPKSFDAVIAVEVIEHLKKSDGIALMNKVEKWATKKIIITTPNGYLHQKPLDKNIFQKHISSWAGGDFIKRGYKVYGLAGLKVLRKESEKDSMNGDFLAPIRFKPRFFWFVILTLSQIFVYFLPRYSFELFCVRNLKH